MINLSEETLVAGAKEIRNKIKVALIECDMKQTELAELIDENPQQLNRAISGDMTPKSLEIRKRIYKILRIE